MNYNLMSNKELEEQKDAITKEFDEIKSNIIDGYKRMNELSIEFEEITTVINKRNGKG